MSLEIKRRSCCDKGRAKRPDVMERLRLRRQDMRCKQARRDVSCADTTAVSISRSVIFENDADDKSLDMDGKEAQISSRRRRCRFDRFGPPRNVSGMIVSWPTTK